MKTQCPVCHAIQKLPACYTNTEIKCQRCKEPFIALELTPPPPRPSKGNFLTNAWAKSPAAYKAGFLATLGVFSAILFLAYFSGFFRELKSHAFPGNQDAYSNYQFSQLDASIQGSGNLLQNLCKLLGELEFAASLKGPWLSEETRDTIIANLRYNNETRLNINWTGRYSPVFKKAIDLLEAATQAEIDVLLYEKQNREKCENGKWYSDADYMKLMEKSMTLRAQADFELIELLGKL